MLAPKNRNELLERARETVVSTTPEPTPVDPSLYTPIQRNPNPVNDAIESLTNARVDALTAADIQRQENFRRQMQQLIAAQFLGAGGALSNAISGGNVQTGIDQRVAQALPMAMGLQDELSRSLIDSSLRRADIQGEAGINIAERNEQARLANEQAIQTQRQAMANAMLAAEERARQTGVDIRTAMQQEMENLFASERIGVSEQQAAAALTNAETNRIQALQPRTQSGGSGRAPRPGETGYLTQVAEDYKATQARLGTTQEQVRRAETGEGGVFGMATGERAAAESLEQEQLQAEAEVRFIGGLRRASTDEVATILDRALETNDPSLLAPTIDELQVRAMKNPNDPVLVQFGITPELLANLEISLSSLPPAQN